MPNIEKIIHDFGRTQEEVGSRIPTHYPSLKFPKSLLPYKKEEIISALDKAIEINRDDSHTIELLNAGRVFLEGFVDDQEAYNSNHQLLGQEGYWEAIRRKNII